MAKSDTISLVQRDNVKFFVELFAGSKKLYPLLKKNLVPNTLYNEQEDYQYLPEQTLKNLITTLAMHKSDSEFNLLLWSACKDIYVPRFIKDLTRGQTLEDTLSEFCQQLVQQSTSANVSIQNKGGRWWLVREKEGVNEPWFKHAEMFAVIFMSQLLKLLTNNEWVADEIALRSADQSSFKSIPELNNALFYTERPVTALSIPDELMCKAATFAKSSDGAVDDEVTLHNLDFLESFKLAIEPYLSMGKLPISLAAEVTNLNVRTLQRRLAKHDVVYSDIIEEIMMSKVLKLLENKDIPITAIAMKFGYSDTSHFIRAFKRHTSLTPSQYRQRHF
jgi:AraC-like DNA-binding protein